MSLDAVAVVISALAAAFAAFAGIMGKRAIDKSTAFKTDAEADSIYIENAKRLVALMEERVAGMEKELRMLQAALQHHQSELDRSLRQETALQRELSMVRARVSTLEIYIRRHGLEIPAAET